MPLRSGPANDGVPEHQSTLGRHDGQLVVAVVVDEVRHGGEGLALGAHLGGKLKVNQAFEVMNSEVIWTSGKIISAVFNSLQNNNGRAARYRIIKSTLLMEYILNLYNFYNNFVSLVKPREVKPISTNCT